jgi:hypothetical protein
MHRKNWIATLLCGAAMGMLPALALAQTQAEPLVPLPPLPTGPQAPAEPGQPLQRGQTIVDRPRPEIDPLGVRAGTFFLFPRAELDEVYNDNIFATRAATKSDFITVLAPSFDLLSNFPRHALNLRGGAAIGRYASHSSENYEDAFASADGRIDLGNLHHVTGLIKYERLHEDRASPDAPGAAAEPVKYNAYTATVGASQTGLRIGWEAEAGVRREEYEAVPLTGGGILPQSDRNVNIYQGSLRGTYEFQPNYQAYLRVSGNSRNYDHVGLPTAPGGPLPPTRDSNGFRIDGGARIDLTGVTYVDGYVGYLQQDYRAAQFGSISGVDFGARLVWNATQLTSVTFRLERTVQDANNEVFPGSGVVVNSPGYLHTVFGAAVDHELLRNLLVNGNVFYANDDYKGVDLTSNVYGAGIGAKYLLNRHLYLGATYNYDHRDPSGSASSFLQAYSRNIFMLRLSTQL